MTFNPAYDEVLRRSHCLVFGPSGMIEQIETGRCTSAI
jgi:hypothetical protein